MTTDTTQGIEPQHQPQQSDDGSSGGSFNVVIHDRPQGSRISVDPVAEVANSTGVLATARTRSGSQIATRPVSGNDLVRHLGGEITVDQAVRLGLVEQRQDGSFVDVEGAVPEVDAAAVADAAEADTLEIDAEIGEAMADWAQALEATGHNPAAIVGQVLSDPSKLPDVLTQMAEDAGKDVGAMSTEFQRVGVEIDRSLEAYVGALGVTDMPAFWAYVHETVGRPQLSSAVISAVFLGDAGPFRGMAAKYLSSTNHEVGSHGSGYGAKSSGQIGGVDTNAATARRLSI